MYAAAVSTDSENSPADLFVSQYLSAGTFTLRSAEDGDVWLEVIDCLGGERYAGREQLNREIKLARAEAGVYVLKVRRNKRVQIFRIVLE